jgi:predicted ATP-dependent endonuclease of OLD family
LFSQLGDQATSVPRQADLRRLRNTHRSLKSAFSILGISPSKTDMVIDPFFDGLIKTGTSISRFKNLGVALQSAREDSFEWINRAPQLSLIRQVERLVNEFNDSERKIFEKIRRYEEIVNSFLNDSKKSISFREDGELLVSLPSTVRSDVLMLSSGERQLFVLITALMFNEDEKQANVLIIDEPELSLHIKWQEMFVSAIRTANPETQVILATHSPSIINDLEEDCVDLA